LPKTFKNADIPLLHKDTQFQKQKILSLSNLASKTAVFLVL